jgi:hypothetical protein
MWDPSLDGPDERRRHGDTDIEMPPDEGDPFYLRRFDDADPSRHLRDGASWAHSGASAATVAQLSEHQRFRARGNDGVVDAETGALPAGIAPCHVNLGNGNRDDLLLRAIGPQEQVRIGLLDITIQEPDRRAPCQGKVDGHGGLARATFT